ncbi:PQQ-dependent sugar dehydrogenase [Aeoliella sp. ICT_H6.2]|uniref:PQQ-dependent sugar dehydrogenase n=1 Tax=Aeoliella straminimaris TaxID=2954799 RepID=A0A9X2FI79_9BACT|nr:PQQ-dependent sugar dehydrogenase [Aeoliella straminimaris]MCO6045661.1 PQQ-dependent sugar dehydrogenase [Aeoliella straminimaris]
MPTVCRNVSAFGLLLSLSAACLAQGPSNETLQEGEQIYMQRCAQCHGKDLTGGNAQSMVDGVWQFGRGDGDLMRNIKFGISSVGMPEYKDVMSDRQIRAVIAFMKEAQNRAGVERPPLPEKLLTRHYDVGVEQWIAEGLEVPWSIAFMDDNTALITERPGRLRVVIDGQLHPDPIQGTPETVAQNQGGYMDVALDPNYKENGWIYLAYSHSLDGSQDRDAKLMTRVVRAKIRDHKWVDQEVVFAAPDFSYSTTRHHFGSRLAFDHEGHLLITVGDRGVGDQAQDLRRPNGKIHRVWPDGSVPEDNPYADGSEGLKTVYCYGNRNPQGLAVHPETGVIWETEHGPMGGDEVNIILAGANYGWPKATYGIDYNGTIITEDLTLPGTEQPVLYWVPSIAVCGTHFCIGDEFPRWQNNLLVGGLGHEELRRLVLSGDRVIHQELLLKNAGRVRDVQCDASGAVYVILNNPDVVLKLTNQGRAIRQ